MARCWRWRSPGWASAAGWAALIGVGACSIDSRELDETASAGDVGSDGTAGGAAGTASAGGTSGASSPLGASGGNPSGAGIAGAASASADGTASGGSGAAGMAAGGAGGAGGASTVAGAGAESGGASGASNAAGAGDGSAGAESGASSGNCPSNLLVNGGFESGEQGWVSFTTGSDPLIYDTAPADYEGVEAHGGQRLGWLGGVPSETNRLSQAVSVPPGTTRVSLRYSVRVQIFEQHATIDFLRLRLVVAGVSTPIAELSNANAGQDWVDYAPEPLALGTDAQTQPLTLKIESTIGEGPGTNFYVDDVALVPTCAP